MRRRVTVLVTALLWTAAAAAQFPPHDGPLVEVGLGEGELVRLPAPAERVALVDETVASVRVISSREVLVQGLAPGRTTLFAWLEDGERLRLTLQVVRPWGLLEELLLEIDPGIRLEESDDGANLLLRGEVADAWAAGRAVALAESMKGDGGAAPAVIDRLVYPGSGATPDEVLERALAEVDPRIRPRRLQVGVEPDPAQDSWVLEGRVASLDDLVRAVILAERQLGGTGTRVEAAEQAPVGQARYRGFGVPTGGVGDGGSGLGVLAGGEVPAGGLAAQVSRGLVVTSESGRVVSFLEVDELPQILVSIRVLEIDRARAQKVGIDYRIDAEHVSIASQLAPGGGALPTPALVRPTVTGIAGELVGAFVDEMTAVVAAIDLLEEHEIARSVAEPNILTLSGEPATVLVGGEVPIPISTTNQVATVQGFFFQDFGVRLDIRPTVDGDGVVTLEVRPSIVRPATSLGVGEVPGFQVQTVQTTARVQAGHSLVLGGLLSFASGLEERKVPWLGDVPVLNALFRWKRRSREQQELLFVITPRLVSAAGEPAVAAAPPGAVDEAPIGWEAPIDRELPAPGEAAPLRP